MVGSFPEKLNNVVGDEMIVLLSFKPHNKKFRTSSIAVVQFSKDPDILNRFTYTEKLVISYMLNLQVYFKPMIDVSVFINI